MCTMRDMDVGIKNEIRRIMIAIKRVSPNIPERKSGRSMVIVERKIGKNICMRFEKPPS